MAEGGGKTVQLFQHGGRAQIGAGEMGVGNAFQADLIQRDFRAADAFARADLAREAVGIDAGAAHHAAQIGHAHAQRLFGLGHQLHVVAADRGHALGLLG